MATGTIPIPPASLLHSSRHLVTGPFMVTEYQFQVPLDYNNPRGPQIQLFARAAAKHEPSVFGPNSEQQHIHAQLQTQRPWIVYLQGGPGFGCPEPQDSSLTRFMLTKGYQILCQYYTSHGRIKIPHPLQQVSDISPDLDYRGVGLSNVVTAGTIPKTTAAQFEHLKLFRQDNNVRDLEAVRQCLTASIGDPAKKKWSIFGQSFGGFVALTYLSKHPEGLREVFMTGGLAPISRSPQEVYQSTFEKVYQRNMAYYSKYPEDVARVREITAWLYTQQRLDQTHSANYWLPGGGTLSPRRFLTLGHMFGMHGGLDNVHAMVLRMSMDLQQYSMLTHPTLAQFEAYLPFDTSPIYAVLHEAIYCHRPGLASNWAAQAVGQELEHFRWLSDEYSFTNNPSRIAMPLCFSGEMIFPFMFEDYPELRLLKDVAQLLAEFDQWEPLYDESQLENNTVPVYAASFIEDMYVDYDLARETARKVKGIRTFETNSMYHNALRARPDDVLPQLFKLRDDCLD